MAIMETVRQHPYLTAGGILVGGVVFIYMLRGGSAGNDGVSGAYAAQPNPDAVQAATSLQLAQMQAASQTQQINAQLDYKTQELGAQVKIAELAAQTSLNNNTILAGVETTRINQAADVAKLQTTLGAQVQQNADNQATKRQEIATVGQTEMQSILADALVKQSTNQKDIAIASTNAQAAVATANIMGNYLTNQAIIANQPKPGLFSRIFG